jgi:EAL domain-containing protein (putative c-di-GMP-specific phosphodiesterase class I)/GAF domain-containing protein
LSINRRKVEPTVVCKARAGKGAGMTATSTAGHRTEPPDWARCHNQALVALARQVWREDCTLETAFATICETAAGTLEVDRVNIWCLEPHHGLLRCVHAYERHGARHNPPGYDEAFDADSEYARRLDEVRVIDADDVVRDATVSASMATLGGYLVRHRIRSLLDAPIRSEGELLGVVCHEQVGTPRAWTADDQAFAASIGDYVALSYEIVRRREAEQHLRYLARHDPDTGLPNRDHLLEVAHGALRPMPGDDHGVVAIHVHVDASAHVQPDAALAAIGKALRVEFSESATVARVRDDAFALLPYRHLREDEALDVAEHALAVVQACGDDSVALQAAASAGISFSRDLAAPSADALLRNAELASRRARSLGALNRCEVYDAGHHRALLARLRVERALREAHEQGRLQVWYQPEVDLRDGRWRAAEALLRWQDDDGRMRPAGEFIDVAEASGLIVPIGRWVLLQACRTARAWPERDGLAPALRVNVSARQFEQPGLVSEVAQALDESGLPPTRLCMELTETVLLADAAAAAQTLNRLRALGIGIALDDFGTGYSSLGYLKGLPIDVLKLDRRFVAGLPDDAYDVAIVRAVVDLARHLGIDIVAEGVETEAQAAALRGCGVQRAQGFLYAGALPQDELMRGFETRA